MIAPDDFELIDGHCHLASTRFTPKEFLYGVVRNMEQEAESKNYPFQRETVLKLIENQYQDHEGEFLISEMDAASIDRAIVLLPDFTYIMDSELTINEMYAEHHGLRQRYGDRLIVFAGVDPRWGEKGLDLFEKGINEYGFKGLKLYPPCGYEPSDKMLYPFYDICQEVGVPVLLHTGPTSPTLYFDYAVSTRIDHAARDFPNVNFILAHAAVNNVEDSYEMAKYRHNVYLDTGAFLGSLDEKGWHQVFHRIKEKGVPHKVIFGTDWPVFKMNQGQKYLIDAIFAEDGPLKLFTGDDIKNVFGQNILRLINQ